jgi:hypothetical protein
VLFSGSEELAELFATGIAQAPDDAAPLEAIAVALDRVAELFAERRAFAAERSRIIAANPELQERELIKMAGLTETVADALRARGVPDRSARLAAEAGIAVFRVTFARWVDPGNEEPFSDIARASMRDLRAVAAA